MNSILTPKIKRHNEFIKSITPRPELKYRHIYDSAKKLPNINEIHQQQQEKIRLVLPPLIN